MKTVNQEKYYTQEKKDWCGSSEQHESVSQTFFSQLFVVNQFAMPQVVEDGTKVSWVSVDHVGSRLILQHIQTWKRA